MTSRLARWVSGGLLAALPFAVTLPALAQPPAPQAAAVDPATVQGLPPARDYRAPSGIAFRASDFVSENVRLTAQWFYAVENEGRTLPTVIMAQGWGATAATLREDAVAFARAGYLVMLFDYRGWGDSDGRVTLARRRPAEGATFTAEVRELRGYVDPWEQTEDWFNAVAYAAADPMVDTGRIGLLGSDLSGGHVLYVAAHEPRVRALVSEVSRVDTRPYKPYQPDPARTIAEANAAASRLATGQEGYPTRVAGAPVGSKVVRWSPVEVADRVKAPALFILAQDEELFSNTNNGQLACERVAGPRKLVMLPKITHFGVYGAERTRATARAIDWFDRYLTPPTAQGVAPARAPQGRKEPERGACNPPPEPPKGEEDPNGSGEARKAQDASARFN